MALARIISRSQQCSRELALDLLARGYTVEIVSPDAIPDNLADLELRVESGPDNVLTASVEAHNGGRSTSLEFVHHLKAPMGNFIRRPPEQIETISIPAVSVSLKVGQSVFDHTTPPVPKRAEPPVFDALRAHEPTLFTLEIPSPAPETVPLIAVPLVAASQQLQSTEPREGEKAKQPVRPVVTAAIHKSGTTLKKKRQIHNRSGAWFGRAALTFAGVLLVAVLLSFGTRRDAASSPSNSGVSSSNAFGIYEEPEAVLAAPPATNSESVAPEHLAVAAAVPSARKKESKPVGEAKESVLTAKTTLAKRRHQTSRSDAGDLVAPNTIVYFGQAGPTSVPVKARHGTRSLKQRDGVIAASKAPDLSAKPASKAPQQK